MRRRCWKALGLILAVAVSGCDPHGGPSNSPGQTTFADREDTPLQPIEKRREYSELEVVEIPAVVQERQAPTAPQTTKEEPTFQLKRPHLVIDKENQKVTLTFEATSKKGTESLELAGKFDRNVAPWTATLYATDKKILNERRVQAVFLCLTAEFCNIVGVDILYVIDGKIVKKQLIDGVSGPALAMSGDTEELNSDEVARPSNPVFEPAPERPQQVPAPVAAPTSKPAMMPPGVLNEDPVMAPSAPPKEVSTVPVNPVPSPTRVQIPLPKPVPLESLPPADVKDKAIEYYGKMNIGLPEKSPYRIQGLEDPKPTDPAIAEPIQAIGAHDSVGARLEKADYLPPEGKGFIRRAFLANPNLTPASDRSLAWGTHRMVNFITQAGVNLAEDLPDSRMVLNNVSAKTGGQVADQASHRTGLDADIRYISTNNNGESFYAVANGRVTRQLDIPRTWEMMKSLCSARRDWVIVIFVDRAVKQAMCNQARQLGEAVKDESSLSYQCLRSLYHSDGHENHAHVRLYCPETRGCFNKIVSLPQGTGCNFK